MKTIYVACGAGFGGDRFDASGPLIDHLAGRDGPRFLIFETLAERTLAIAQNQMLRGEGPGYSEYLERYLAPVLKPCQEAGIKIISNLGAANVAGAGRRARELADGLGLDTLKIAVVEGDDLLCVTSEDAIAGMEPVEGTSIERPLVGANVYLGARPIAQALELGADVVLTGRCTDAALTLGPVVHAFDVDVDDLHMLAAGTLAGHLLECGPQVTGAYFADPPYKNVPDLANVGYPVGEISDDGNIVITKPAGTGGLVSEATVKEQILYEMHDPANYLTPDVTLDVSEVQALQDGPDRVRVAGARGKPPPATLKATVSMDAGYLGEAEMSYAGPNARARAELAIEILRQRFQRLAISCPVRFDVLGIMSVFDDDDGHLRAAAASGVDGDLRVRVAARSDDRDELERIATEVYSLWVTGPAGGAGFRKHLSSKVKTASVLVDPNLPDVTVRLV
ncbi:MAG: acyclic terpene utilization AtuA family protein [Pseudomonadota bacterium]